MNGLECCHTTWALDLNPQIWAMQHYFNIISLFKFKILIVTLSNLINIFSNHDTIKDIYNGNCLGTDEVLTPPLGCCHVINQPIMPLKKLFAYWLVSTQGIDTTTRVLPRDFFLLTFYIYILAFFINGTHDNILLVGQYPSVVHI